MAYYTIKYKTNMPHDGGPETKIVCASVQAKSIRQAALDGWVDVASDHGIITGIACIIDHGDTLGEGQHVVPGNWDNLHAIVATDYNSAVA